MKIYGYESDDSDLIGLNEISMQVSLEELKKISVFFQNTIKLMEENDKNFGHEHYKDFYNEISDDEPEIIIINKDYR